MTSEIHEAENSRPADDAKSRSRGIKVFIRDIFFIVVAALLVSFLIKTFVMRSFYIPSESMEDTLITDDRVIVNELTPDLMPISHGDVIVFTDPGDWLPPFVPQPQNPFATAVGSALSFVGLTASDSNDHLIKRVIGLPGDHVVCCNEFGQLSVNGVPLDEPYIKLPDGVTKATPNDFDVTVPADSLWVMGDNRYHSADSSYHQVQGDPHVFVPYSDVVGRAVVITWPINRWTFLDNHSFVFRDVEDGKK